MQSSESSRPTSQHINEEHAGIGSIQPLSQRAQEFAEHLRWEWFYLLNREICELIAEQAEKAGFLK